MRLAVATAALALAGCEPLYHVDPADPGAAGDARLIDDGSAPDGTLAGLCTPKPATETTAGTTPPTYFIPGATLSVWFQDAVVVEGTAPGPSYTVAFSNAAGTPTQPRLEPDETHMFVFVGSGLVEAHRNALTAIPWVADATQVGITGAPSTTTQDRLHLIADDHAGTFVDYSRADASLSAWTAHTRTTASALGLSTIKEPHLSLDGRRIVFAGTAAASSNTLDLYYADRPAVNNPFGMAIMLLHVALPVATIVTPYMTDDCTKLTYSNGGALVIFTP